MKMTRTRFEYLTDKFPNHTLYKINDNLYLEFKKPKAVLKALWKFIFTTVTLPIAFLLAVCESLWEVVSEIPRALMDIIEYAKRCIPIGYIKIVDNEESIK